MIMEVILIQESLKFFNKGHNNECVWLNALIEKVKDANESEYESACWAEFKNALYAAKLFTQSTLVNWSRSNQWNDGFNRFGKYHDDLLNQKDGKCIRILIMFYQNKKRVALCNIKMSVIFLRAIISFNTMES